MKKEKPGNGRIFVVSGPSGSGKSTLAQGVLAGEKLKKILVRSISYTTRPKRTGETDKKDYFFISEKDFKAKRGAKKILEWTRYLGYYYGTPLAFVTAQLKKGRSIVLCLDIRGAMRLKRLFPREAVTIFVKPSSLEELPGRISKRCARTKKEEIRQRLALAKNEIKSSSHYDYRVINKDLKVALKALEDIIRKETQR